ncbi:integrase, catalytic region, zinc finger, CCHC-type containing protein [Tanacetum coccineum]
MSTSKTYQQSLADAGSETRPPMLERGSYIPWASRFRRYINRKRENQKWLNKALDEGPYQFQMFVPTGSTLPTLQTAEDLQGDELLHYDAEIELMNLILLSIPNEIYNSVDAFTTTKEMWKRFEREALVSVYNRFAQLMNDLERNKMIFPSVKKFEKLVIASRAKKLEKSHDPLALVAHTGSSSENTSILLCNASTCAFVHEESCEGLIAQNESKNVQRTLRTSSSGNNSTVQCYNYNGKGHYARNCPKPRVRDSKYFMEQMLLAKQDEARVILTDEQNDFLFADASRMEEIKELSANICLMARIQPADNTSDAGASYDYAFFSEVQSSSI